MSGADRDKGFGKHRCQRREFEQAEDTGIKGKLNNNAPDCFTGVFGGLEKTPGPPVEKNAQHQEKQIDIVQIDGFVNTHLADLPSQPNETTCSNDDIPAPPPVRPG